MIENTEKYLGVKLDNNNYFAGDYIDSPIKEIVEANGVLVNSFPPNEDMNLWPAYKYENEKWILDEEKLKEIQESISKQNIIEQKLAEIEEFKQKLANTDYVCNKWKEGWLTDEQYHPFKMERQSYREEINKLEEEIKSIEER